MRWRAIILSALASAMLTPPASAKVTTKAPDGIAIQVKAQVPLDRDDAWARLLDIALWWNGSHTYSGDAGNLSIDAVAGGCWCELWSGGEVQHGRVLAVMPRDMIRFEAPLGPLQEMGVGAALTFTLADGPSPSTTVIVADFKVTGSSLSGLDRLAGVIDGVITEQVTRYASAR